MVGRFRIDRCAPATGLILVRVRRSSRLRFHIPLHSRVDRSTPCIGRYRLRVCHLLDQCTHLSPARRGLSNNFISSSDLNGSGTFSVDRLVSARLRPNLGHAKKATSCAPGSVPEVGRLDARRRVGIGGNIYKLCTPGSSRHGVRAQLMRCLTVSPVRLGLLVQTLPADALQQRRRAHHAVMRAEITRTGGRGFRAQAAPDASSSLARATKSMS